MTCIELEFGLRTTYCRRIVVSQPIHQAKISETWLPNTGITNNSDSHTSRKTSKATSKTRRKMSVSIKKIIRFGLGVNPGTDNHRNNQSVNT
ncbi:hypothetical protein Ccrd_009249 [Cynara cardunculus var. scolymus]|uniref:Uncharacterized protein n=1 Tax=Cynara cardunculus var. scolymus TaxID=59895 RepID=A0A124SIC9_CYNCS|nr:hypothetical protein Ccrd_009249 [Cynara cardunculus var. scolymus]